MADLDQFQLGTLSHMINVKANGYQELPDWPEVPPDSSVRDVDVQMSWMGSSGAKSKLAKKKAEKEKSFYSEDESSSSEGQQVDSVYHCQSSSSSIINRFLTKNARVENAAPDSRSRKCGIRSPVTLSNASD